MVQAIEDLDVTTLTGRVGANETAITALQNADTALDGRVGANETAITALQGADTQINAAIDLKADKTTVEGIDGRVGANETAIAGINNETTGIAAVAAQNLASAKSELEGKINAKADTTTVSGIDGRLTTAEGEIDTLQAGIANVYTKAEADALLDEKQDIFKDVELCTQNGAYDCAAVANKDGTFGWQRIVYTAADKTSTN